jgi:hypothetical protein
MRILLSLSLLLAWASCTASPKPPPDQVARSVIAALDQHDEPEAIRLFETSSEQPTDRDKMYPVLYAAASERYLQGDFSGSASLLRFTAQRYPEARAVREALLYSLVLQRAEQSSPDPALLREIEQLLEEIQDTPGAPFPWLDLVATQHFIDRQCWSDARHALQRFETAWSGSPPGLSMYVEDLQRFLEGNAGTGGPP